MTGLGGGHIVRSIPEGLKFWAVGLIWGIPVKDIQEGLDLRFFVDEMSLDATHGHRVFSEDRKAVIELMPLLGLRDAADGAAGDNSKGAGKGKKGDNQNQRAEPNPVSAEAKEWARMAIDDLVAGNRILAEATIIDTEIATTLDPKRQGKVDRELQTARDELDRGDTQRDRNNPDKALQHYRKAWEHATKAMKEQARLPGS